MSPNTTDEGVERATLYFDPEKDKFLVMGEARKGYGTIEVGLPVQISGSEFEESISNILRQTLSSFHKNSQTNAVPKTAEEYASFRSTHLCVGIERVIASGEIRITPRHRLQGGYVGRLADQIVVGAVEFDEQIAVSLRRAFENAS